MYIFNHCLDYIIVMMVQSKKLSRKNPMKKPMKKIKSK